MRLRKKRQKKKRMVENKEVFMRKEDLKVREKFMQSLDNQEVIKILKKEVLLKENIENIQEIILTSNLNKLKNYKIFNFHLNLLILFGRDLYNN